jgi:two-component system chemotaxis response regulator CheB
MVLLNQDAPKNSCRPSADPLFRSAASIFGERLLAVVLTGMGQDGVDGCKEVKSLGGSVIVQDQSSSIVWGMPGAVARAGLADEVLSLPMIAEAIERRTQIGSAR